MSSIMDKLEYLLATKEGIQSALVSKGQAPTEVFRSYAGNILDIEGGGGGGVITLISYGGTGEQAVTSISQDIACGVGQLIVAIAYHRTTEIGSFTSTWTKLYTSTAITSVDGTIQYVTVFYKVATSTSENFTFSGVGASRTELAWVVCSGAGTPSVITTQSSNDVTPISRVVTKTSMGAGIALWIAHIILSADNVWSMTPDTVVGYPATKNTRHVFWADEGAAMSRTISLAGIESGYQYGIYGIYIPIAT